MTYSRLFACFTAAALLAACSEKQDSSVGQVADDAAKAEMTAMDSTANDGGIPLSATNKTMNSPPRAAGRALPRWD